MTVFNRWAELSPVFQFFKMRKVWLEVYDNQEAMSDQGKDTEIDRHYDGATGMTTGVDSNIPKGRVYVHTFPWNAYTNTAVTSLSIKEIAGWRASQLKPGWRKFDMGRPRWMTGEKVDATMIPGFVDKPAGWVPYTAPDVQHWIKSIVWDSKSNYVRRIIFRYRAIIDCKGQH